MRDPEEPLRTAYYQALKDKIELNGVPVPVYVTAVPSSAPAPYVAISELTVAEEIGGAAACKFWDCSVLIDIVTQFDNNLQSPSHASRIGAMVKELVKQKTLGQVMNAHLEVQVDDTADLLMFQSLDEFENLNHSWGLFSHRLELSISRMEGTSTDVVNRRLMTFRDRLEETTAPATSAPVESGGFILTEAGYRIRLI